jgi:uncharacterized protein YecE (DUF72 family)
MIRIGTSGWSYKDWNGIVYPKPKPRGFDELEYIARYFNTVEINSSYYGSPRATAAKKWGESVAENRAFRFTAKLLHTFTHEREASRSDEKEFKDGIAPLMDAGRFGALLLQFQWSFRNTPEDRQYLIGLHNRFRDYPLVLEVRHASWTQPEILDMLAELGIALCNIDQPLFKGSVKPAAEATSSIGYVRLHGRNYKTWFAEKPGVRERYDFLYSPEELEPWVARIRELSDKTEDTYAMSNNHNLGKAAVNSLQIAAMLMGRPVPAPPLLAEHYPQLEGFVQKA